MTDNPEHPPRPLPFDREPSPPSPAASHGPEAASAPRPAIADDADHRLDPNWVTASRLAGLITTGVIAALALIPTLTVPLAAGFGALGWLVALGLWFALALGLAGLTFGWPALRYRHASYRVNDRGIQIRSGVLFRSVVSVPRSRVQHTDVSRGPLERNFGLATLIIHTAGTEHASVSQSGLPAATADAIRDYLIEGGDDDAV